MSDERTEPHDPDPESRIDEADIPDTVGPVEQVTPATGALGRPDFSANPFSG